MPTISRLANPPIVQVTLLQGMQESEFTQALSMIRQACAEQPTSGVLIDCRSGEQLPSVEARRLLARRVAMHWPARVALAVLLQPELHAPDHSFANALEQLGVRVEIFHDVDAAIAWLQSKRPGEVQPS